MRKGQAAIGEGPPLRYKSCQATDTKDTVNPSLRQTFSLWPRHRQSLHEHTRPHASFPVMA